MGLCLGEKNALFHRIMLWCLSTSWRRLHFWISLIILGSTWTRFDCPQVSFILKLNLYTSGVVVFFLFFSDGFGFDPLRLQNLLLKCNFQK